MESSKWFIIIHYIVCHLAKLECLQVNIKNAEAGWGQWIWILKITPTVTQKGHVSNGTGYSLNATPSPWSGTRSKHRFSLIPTRLPSFCPSFPAGAFIPGVPVQPVLLRYPNEMVRITWMPKQGVSLLSLLNHILSVCSCVLCVFNHEDFEFIFHSPIKYAIHFFSLFFFSTVETFLFLSVCLLCLCLLS